MMLNIVRRGPTFAMSLVARLYFIVMRGLVPRTYPWGRPDGVAAPKRVGPRNACARDDIEASV